MNTKDGHEFLMNLLDSVKEKAHFTVEKINTEPGIDEEIADQLPPEMWKKIRFDLKEEVDVKASVEVISNLFRRGFSFHFSIDSQSRSCLWTIDGSFRYSPIFTQVPFFMGDLSGEGGLAFLKTISTQCAVPTKP